MTLQVGDLVLIKGYDEDYDGLTGTVQQVVTDEDGWEEYDVLVPEKDDSYLILFPDELELVAA